ncbi:MAG: hypothetical protein GY841_04555 [FCB group bacterium]|nr:hypothetical protein [FCB group bacterium]
MAGADLYSSDFSSKDITSEAQLLTDHYVNNTGVPLIVSVAVQFAGLNNDNTKTLTMSMNWNYEGVAALFPLLPKETFNKPAGTTARWANDRSVIIPDGGSANVKAESNDAGNDTAASGTVYFFAHNIADVYTVGFSTPADANLLDKASRIRANKGIQHKDDGHMIIRNDDDTSDLYQIDYTNTGSDLSRELTVL